MPRFKLRSLRSYIKLMIYEKEDFKKIKYEIRDLLVLQKVIGDEYGENSAYVSDFQKNVLKELKSHQEQEGGLIKYSELRGIIADWVMLEISGFADSLFTPDGKRKHESEKRNIIKQVLHFIFDEPLESVPLKINDRSLKIIVKWRLRIGK